MLQPRRKYKLIPVKLDKEIIVRTRESDHVMKVKVGEKEYMFHLEFITRYRPDDAQEAYRYGGSLSAKYDCDVVTILLVLKPSRPVEKIGCYEVSPFGVPLNRHQYGVVRLWEFRDRILAGDKRLTGLVPILPEISPVVDKSLLERQRELIYLTKDPDRQAELLFYTMAFAERYFDRNFLVKFLLENKKMIEHWEQVPGFGDLIKKRVRDAEHKAVKEGEKKGEMRGKLSALRDSIADILQVRFGTSNGRIYRKLLNIDQLRTLQSLHRHALTVSSLGEFVAVLDAKRAAARSRKS